MAERPTTYVIFDLDGTLLDTEALYSEAAQRVCTRYGARYSLELKRSIMGGDAMHGAERVVQTLGLPISPACYLQQRDAELCALLPTVVPMAGAEALIEGLQARGVPMAIATSGHRAVTEQKLALQPFLSVVRAVVCGDDPRLSRPKPAPDIYLLAAGDLGASPAHCWVVEDSLNGVRAGIASGMRTIALVDPRWGFSPSQFRGAERTVASLREVTFELLGVARKPG